MTPGSVESGRSISDGKESKARIAAYTLDTAATFVAAEGMTVTPEEGERLRKKIDRHILPLMSSTPTLAPAPGAHG